MGGEVFVGLDGEMTGSGSPKKAGPTIIGDDGDIEALCEHGIGHSDDVHTCDGCCDVPRVRRTEQYAIAMLNALRFKPRTAEAIVRELDLPPSVVFRLLSKLRVLGLIVVLERVLTRRGKRANLYIATVAYAPNPNYARLSGRVQ